MIMAMQRANISHLKTISFVWEKGLGLVMP